MFIDPVYKINHLDGDPVCLIDPGICLTSTSCFLLLVLYAAKTMNHMIREMRRKVAGTAVTRIEASKMPCNKAIRCM